MAPHEDPRLLFSLGGIRAYHIQNDGRTGHEKKQTEEQDFYLHLNLPPELDLPMPATTQIYHQPPSSYLIPRWDLAPEAGAFTKVEFPPVGKGPGTITQEDIDTFETILAQCTAFLERSMPPKSDKPFHDYDPRKYAKNERYPVEQKYGQVVLVDEENGSVVGELAEGAHVVEDPMVQHGDKDPVEVQVSADGKRIDVRPISDDYLELSRMPQYQKSTLVQNAAAASRLIVTGSSYLGNMMSTGADNFVTKTKPTPKPMEFKPATHDRVRKIHNFTHGAHGLSTNAVGQVSKYAQNFGAGLTRRQEKKPKMDKEGNAQQSKPGFLNKSLIAFTTVADGIAYSGKTLLTQGGAAASTVVQHRWGDQAGSLASDLAGGVKNVGLVYIDVTGVTRRAVVKSVAKGMVVGKMKDGKQVVVGGGDGGEFTQNELKAAEAAQQQAVNNGQEYGTVGGGSGAAPPPAYSPQDYYGSKSGGPPAQGEKGQYRY